MGTIQWTHIPAGMQSWHNINSMSYQPRQHCANIHSIRKDLCAQKIKSPIHPPLSLLISPICPTHCCCPSQHELLCQHLDHTHLPPPYKPCFPSSNFTHRLAVSSYSTCCQCRLLAAAARFVVCFCWTLCILVMDSKLVLLFALVALFCGE